MVGWCWIIELDGCDYQSIRQLDNWMLGQLGHWAIRQLDNLMIGQFDDAIMGRWDDLKIWWLNDMTIWAISPWRYIVWRRRASFQKKYHTLTFLNSSWDVHPRNIKFDTIKVFLELKELMEIMEFMDGVHGIYWWSLWNLLLELIEFMEFMELNCFKPYTSGVQIPRQVQKCGQCTLGKSLNRNSREQSNIKW